MKYKEFLVAFLGKTLKMPEEKVASLFTDEEGTELKPDALNELLGADKTLKDSLNKSQFENGMKKATKEILTDFEKSVKEKFEIDSEKQGIELIEELIQSKSAPGEIEVNKVKLHPEYLALERKLATEVKAKEKEWQDKYEGFEKKIAREKTFSGVIKKADALLSEFDLPKDDKLRENQKRLLSSELEKFNYQINGDELIVMDAEGNPVQDGHGSRRAFDDLVKEIAGNYWPKLNGKERSGTGANNDQQGTGNPGNKWNNKVPTSEQEFSQVFASLKSAEERMALTDAYDAAQARG